MTGDYKTFKIGDRIAEYDLGTVIESVVIENPVRSEIRDGNFVQWSWKTKTDNGRIIEYLRTEGWEHYCGRLKKIS